MIDINTIHTLKCYIICAIAYAYSCVLTGHMYGNDRPCIFCKRYCVRCGISRRICLKGSPLFGLEQWIKRGEDGNSAGFYSTFPITFKKAILLVIPVDNAEVGVSQIAPIAWGPNSSTLTQAYIVCSTGNGIYSLLAVGI